MDADARGRDRTLSPVCAAACVAILVTAASCATRVPPALPAVLAHPEFLYPVVPARFAAAPGVSRIEMGWRYLQANDLTSAEVEFGVSLRLGPGLYPARAGQGYVAMARGDYDRALGAFDAALESDARYVPALVGRGLALVELDRTGPALAAFEAALSEDASLDEVSRRVEVLRVRSRQDLLEAAREAAASGRVEDARRAYHDALADAPGSAALHRELGLLERRAGNLDASLDQLRQAVDLDPSDAASLVVMGELLDARGDLDGAEAAYRRAAAANPAVDLRSRIAVVAERAREARLPPQFQAARTAAQITRGELAALIGVRLDAVLRAAPVHQVVMTDTRGHWAAAWITAVAGAGVIEPFDDHTFQPNARLRRGDLATVVSRLVALVEAKVPAVRQRATGRPAIADLNPGHAQYGAVVTAVASGVMTLVEGDRFLVSRQASGEEAVEAIDRVRAMATRLGATSP